MKTMMLTLIILISTNVFAEEYCANVENPIEEDHRWIESDFTLESAQNALNKLGEAVNEKRVLDWYESANYYTLIEGYLLIRAIKLNSHDEGNKEFHINNFCRFLTSRPIVD